MKPILYDELETSFKDNGIGVLTDAISCYVEEGLNTDFELTMEYRDTGIHAAELTDRRIICAKPSAGKDPQPFRIYRIEKKSSGTIKVYARHIAYDATGIPIGPVVAASAAEAMNEIPKAASVECPFTLKTDKNTVAAMDTKYPRPLWKLLAGTSGSVLDVYGGEYEFDKWTINLLARRGSDRGVSIRYGKNLTSLEQERNCAGCYTGVEPYWIDQEENLVRLPEKVIHADGTYSYTRILTLDLSQEFQEQPTEEQLRAKATRYMTDNSIGVPEVTWKVEFVQLEQTEEYKGSAILERVALGDTVTVIFPKMDVAATARAVSVEYDVLLDRYESITLGKVKSSLTSMIARQGKEIQDRPKRTEIGSMISAGLADAFGVHGGAVRLLDTNADGQPDELYIADNPDPDKAVKVWRFNYEGWAASQNGYNGPFELGATVEKGILAKWITAGNITAGTIGSADGNFFVDLDNGIVNINATSVKKNGNDLLTEDEVPDVSEDKEARKIAGEAKTTAGEAKTAADNAQSAADNAKIAAGNAQATADNAKTTAAEAKTAADNAKTEAQEYTDDIKDELAGRIQAVETESSAIRTNASNLSAEVERVKTSVSESVAGLNQNIQEAIERASLSMTADEVRIEIENSLANGVDSVTTKTGFSFDADGLNVSKSGSEMSTKISEDGMEITQNGENTLTANHTGVDAKNLHATTYLIIGKNSRMEDYGKGTGCFYIGNGEE